MRSFFVIVLVLIATPVMAATLKDSFTAGVVAFNEGRYEEAMNTFAMLVERYGMTSPDVFLNLGASEFMAGRPGLAILHLHKAAKASGTRAAEIALVNLERIRTKLNQDRGAKAGFVFGKVSDAWTAMFSWADARWSIGVFLCVWIVFFSVLGGYRLTSGKLKKAFGYVAVAFVVVVLASATIAYGSYKVSSYRIGVIIRDGAGLYDSIGTVEKSLVLPEGLELRVDDVRGGYVHVHLSSGKEGWVQEDAVGIP